MRKYAMVIILTALVLLVGCGRQPATGAVSGPTTDDVTGEVKEFTVRAFQFGYEPSTLEVNLGDKVIIHGYTSDVAHSITIPQFYVSMSLTSKTPVTTEFIADTPGEFTFYCSIPCGSGHGRMRGKLIVNG